jgi:tetratricopeptide (TPR) repeat protein
MSILYLYVPQKEKNMSEEMTAEMAKKIIDEATDRAAELLDTKPAMAEIILKQLMRIDPEHSTGLQLLGLAKHRLGKNAEAIEIFQTALELYPDNADNYSNIGIAYGALGNNQRAIENIKKAIALNPSQFLYYNNLALQYRIIGDHKSAVATLETGIEIAPNEAQMWTNLGGIYGEMKQIRKSLECFSKALEIDPCYAAAHVDTAFAHHLLGEWEDGFDAYEWRFNYFDQMKYYKNAYDQSKRWNGVDSLEGKTILIYAEQGLGDCIQFLRFIPKLKSKGCKIIIHCPEGLDSIVKRIEGVDGTSNRDIVNNTGDEFPPYDYQCAMMSLPHLLRCFKYSGKPYIKPVTTKFKNFVEDEYGSGTFKIGLMWAGSPAHPHDQRRSIPLKHFRPIHDTEGITLFSLQFDTRPRKYGGFEMRPGSEGKIVDYSEGCEGMKLIDLTTMIKNMEDTCTILAGLDLVISCDTAVVHLAGAMGVPCWMLLPFNPDWRWGIDGDTTLWYDSVKIFRQKERDDWPSVIKEVKKELNETLLQNK